MFRVHALRVAARRYFGALASAPLRPAADDARCWRRSPHTGLPCLLPAGHGGGCWRWEARA
ncbi:MAG: hypothetical protein NTY77_15535 [Elusimicrobia bacterium]|nr:hypothetical protein [Elusimicrobiota bacterium]